MPQMVEVLPALFVRYTGIMPQILYSTEVGVDSSSKVENVTHWGVDFYTLIFHKAV